jgi:hypothetical protein
MQKWCRQSSMVEAGHQVERKLIATTLAAARAVTVFRVSDGTMMSVGDYADPVLQSLPLRIKG